MRQRGTQRQALRRARKKTVNNTTSLRALIIFMRYFMSASTNNVQKGIIVKVYWATSSNADFYQGRLCIWRQWWVRSVYGWAGTEAVPRRQVHAVTEGWAREHCTVVISILSPCERKQVTSTRRHSPCTDPMSRWRGGVTGRLPLQPAHLMMVSSLSCLLFAGTVSLVSQTPCCENETDTKMPGSARGFGQNVVSKLQIAIQTGFWLGHIFTQLHGPIGRICLQVTYGCLLSSARNTLQQWAVTQSYLW